MSQQMTYRSIQFNLTGGGVADQVSETPIRTSFFEVQFDTTAGFVGGSDVDTTFVDRAAATVHQFRASEVGSVTKGDYFDLSKIYVVGTAGNAVTIQYLVIES